MSSYEYRKKTPWIIIIQSMVFGRKLKPHQSKIIDEAIADDRDEALAQGLTEQRGVVVVGRQDGLVEEGKGDDGVDVEHDQTQYGHPKQRHTWGGREGGRERGEGGLEDQLQIQPCTHAFPKHVDRRLLQVLLLL